MKKLLFLIYGLSVTLAVKSQNTFQYVGNGTSNSTVKQIYTIASSKSGGFYLTGKNNLSVNVFDYITARYDSSGMPVWVKKMDPSQGFYPNSVFSTADGGCLVLGYSYDIPSTNHFSQLVRFDSIGNVMWSSEFANPFYYSVGSNSGPFHLGCVEKNTGGFFIAMSLSNDSAQLINTDGGGNIIWVKEFSDGFNYNFSLSFNSTKDKLIMSSFTNAFNPDNTIACFDTLGQMIWGQRLIIFPQFSLSLVSTDDKIYTAGSNRLRQFDLTGTLNWEKEYKLTGADSVDWISIEDFKLFNDTELLITGRVGMMNDLIILRTNMQGNVVKTLRLPLDVNILGSAAYPRITGTSDNRVLFTALHDTLDNSFLFKVDPAFPVGAICNSTQPQVIATLVQPNITQIHNLNTVANSPYAVFNFPFVPSVTTLPFDDYCTVSGLTEYLVPGIITVSPNPVESGEKVLIKLPESFSGSVNIFDINGREVAFYQPGGAEDYLFNTRGMQSGVYFIRATSASAQLTSKLVIR